MSKWQRATAAISSATRAIVHLRIPLLSLLPVLGFIAIAQLVASRYSFHPWAAGGVFSYARQLLAAAFPASLSAVGTGLAKMSLRVGRRRGAGSDYMEASPERLQASPPEKCRIW